MRAVVPHKTATPLTMPPGDDLEQRLGASPLLVLLDIDGTLAPIAPTPEGAVVPPATLEAVARLVGLSGVHVALVTGRAVADGRRMVDVPGTWVIGNHGIERLDPSGGLHVDAGVRRYESDLARAAADLASRLAGVSGAIVEDKRWTLSVHYRLVDPALRPRIQSEAEDVARRYSLRCIIGKQVLELRPPVDVNKGTAALALADSFGIVSASSDARTGAILCIGDDRTDEDAFRLLRARRPDSVTIHVGAGGLVSGEQTIAELLLPDTDAVRGLLEWLAAVRQ